MNGTYTAEDAHAAVTRGAKWLDTKCPTWFTEINVERLNLASPTFCVLGQTARCLLGEKPNGHAVRHGYDKVIMALPEASFGNEWPEDHGFCTPYPEGDAEDGAQWEMLTIAWREYIRQRLEQAL